MGREEEMGRALDAMEEVRSGKGQTLFVVGEPGIGKSRMLADLRERVEETAGVWIEGRCSSLGTATPYLPFRDLVRGWCGVDRPEAPDAADLLRHRLGEIAGGDADEIRPYLGRLLEVTLEGPDARIVQALSADALQFRTVEALARLIGAAARRGFLAVAIEDLHWADASSIQAVGRLLGRVEAVPFLFVVATRDEPEHPSSVVIRTAQQDHTAVIRLDTLAHGADRSLLEAIVGPGVLPNVMFDRLLDAGSGNPFHLEELLRGMVDAGALTRENGGWRFEHDAEVDVPPSIDRVLLARIDRLEEAPRQTLLAASVIGRRFDLSLLLEVTDVDTVDVGLPVLVRADLIRPAGSASYSFKHALIQEVAYATLVRKHRRELHARAARALAREVGETESLLPLLAHHHRAAGQLEEALAAHRSAARAALRVSALPEALHHLDDSLAIAAELGVDDSDAFSSEDRYLRGRTRARVGDFDEAVLDLRALAGLPATPQTEGLRLDALVELGAVLAGAADYREAELLLQDAVRRAEDAGDARRTAVALARRSIVRTNLLQLAGAVDDADQALALARAADDEEAVAGALDAAELVWVMLGEFETVDRIVEELAPIHRRRGDLWFLQYSLFQCCWGPLARCDWDRALAFLDEAEAIANRIGDHGVIPMYGAVRCWLSRSRGRYQEGIEIGRRAVSLAEELGHWEWRSWTAGQLGRLLFEAGALDEAGEALEHSLSMADASGSTIGALRAASHLAAVQVESGDADRAGPLIDRSFRILSSSTAPPERAYVQGADAPIALAQALVKMGQPNKALDLAVAAERAATGAGWHEYTAFARLAVGDARIALGDRDGAVQSYRAAIADAADRIPAGSWRAHAALAGTMRSTEHEERARDIIDDLRGSVTDASIADGLQGALLRRLA
jgi:tetratricopeptide (TPR) repeat protein